MLKGSRSESQGEREKEYVDKREAEIKIDREKRREGGNRPQETREESFEFYV